MSDLAERLETYVRACEATANGNSQLCQMCREAATAIRSLTARVGELEAAVELANRLLDIHGTVHPSEWGAMKEGVEEKLRGVIANEQLRMETTK